MSSLAGENQATSLVPKVSLTNFGLPWESVSEASYKEYARQVLKFVQNTGIDTVYHHIGDYLSDKKGVYNFLNPNPDPEKRIDTTSTGEITPWFVTYFLEPLGQELPGVELGVIPSTNPRYAWHLYDSKYNPDQYSTENYDNNIDIGDGINPDDKGKIRPMDNMHQMFMLIDKLNNYPTTSGKKITRVEIDHEGGGDYQDDTIYGPKNDPTEGKYAKDADHIGFGYVKYLWNQFMPETDSDGNALAFKNTDPSSSEYPDHEDFKGHYRFGFINYRTDAWQKESQGSIDAFAENYWFGELEYKPLNDWNDKTSQNEIDSDIFDYIIHTDTGEVEKALDHVKSYSIKTISEMFGEEPKENFDDQGRINGGSNLADWYGYLTAGGDGKKGNKQLDPHAVDSLYRYYRDYPEKIADLFDDDRYPSGGDPPPIPIPGHDPADGWGAPHLSEEYYQPLDFQNKWDSKNTKAPQGGVPTFSIENISSTNLDRVNDNDNYDSAKRLSERVKDAVGPSLIGHIQTATYPDNPTAAHPDYNVDPNSIGGTFDGLSALEYDDLIVFLNRAATIISEQSDGKLQPSDVTLAIYEAPFLPMSWIDQKVPNDWSAKVLEGSSGDDVLRGGNGRQTLMGLGGDDTLIGGKGFDFLTGGEGADTFRFDTKGESKTDHRRDVITDFNGEEGDKIHLSNIDKSLVHIGSDPFSGTQYEVRFEDGLLHVNLNQGLDPDMVVELSNVTSFSSDFLA